MKSPNKLLAVSSDHWLDNTTRSAVTLPSLHKSCEQIVFFLFLYIISIGPYRIFNQVLHTKKKKEGKGKIIWDKIKKCAF